MNLYILRNKAFNWSEHDVARGFVIRAKNKRSARQLASAMCGHEGKGAWLDSENTSCKKLKSGGTTQEVILKDFFNAG